MNIKNLDNYILYLFALLFPIFVYPKIALAAFVILLILALKAIIIGITGKASLARGNFDLPVLLITIPYLLSTVFITPNKMDAIVFPGNLSLIIFGGLIYFLVNQLSLKGKGNFALFLFAGGVIYAVVTLLSIANLIPWFKPEGGYLTSALYLGALIPAGISLIVKQKSFAEKSLIVVCLSIMLFAITASVFFNSLKYPSFQTSTAIAMGALKQNPILGVGPGNYLSAFDKYRPIDFNKTAIWANKFEFGSSYLITLLTEVGVLGLITFLILFVVFIVAAFKEWSISLLSPLILFIFLGFFPGPPMLMFTLFCLLGLGAQSKKHEYVIPSKLASVIISMPILVLISLASYKAYVLSFAEYNYVMGLKYISQNKAKEAYDHLKIAINLNQKVDRYHQVMSSINFAVAVSISNQEQITLLIQESINEAKASVALNNQKPENWEFLAKTYKLITPVAIGADGFAIEAYKQAIAFDPISPNLRIGLGEIYMYQKNFKEAIEAFSLSALAKDDHPNAHFNLALAYKENGEKNKAKLELEKTLSLLDKNSEDYKKAKTELDNLVNLPR